MDPFFLSKAIKIAAIAHVNDVDKAGRPYMLHLIHVMNQMETDELRTVAILHDLIEDHPENTPSALRHQGFPDRIVDAVVAITKKRGEPYEVYIARVKANPLARRVKIADLIHNSDRRRLPGTPTAEDLKRWRKYEWALEQLYFDGGIVSSPLGDLEAEFKAWCENQRLPWVSAEELLLHNITSAQRQWLETFIEHWQNAQEKEDNIMHLAA
jgi:hypothetical protein